MCKNKVTGLAKCIIIIKPTSMNITQRAVENQRKEKWKNKNETEP